MLREEAVQRGGVARRVSVLIQARVDAAARGELAAEYHVVADREQARVGLQHRCWHFRDVRQLHTQRAISARGDLATVVAAARAHDTWSRSSG